MPPSRRATLGLFGTTATALLAGCSAAGLETDDDATAQSGSRTETDEGGTPTADAADPASVEMRLVGPETDRTLFTGAGVSRVGEVQKQRSGGYGLPVVLADATAAEVSEAFRAAGVGEDPDPFEVVLRYDGETVNRFGVSARLAADIAEGEWEGEFILMVEDRETAAEIRQTLADD
ncbi:hypothetical protein SAMN04487947_0638 [Halogeometricum rufum]|uniref:Preprotein translocase subunit SecD n=1 Tax=Halogeometricum rufum TaxID=553469 RepID=A0A1I6G6P1_9EURY|nr:MULTISPECIES: hypothetical protein [Halogeometricum]MUV58371.1 hypothetical protein [Halogeometricum sp. CBA1124]SFR37717.1 hypothetical protein SAMN04487947_0638 [Halogeometricum rufum]